MENTFVCHIFSKINGFSFSCIIHFLTKIRMLQIYSIIIESSLFSVLKVVEECRAVGRKDARFGYVVADMLQYEKTTDKLIKVLLWLL